MTIFSLLTLIMLLVVVALRERLQIAIELIKEGAKAAGTMCCSYFFPIIPFIMHITGKIQLFPTHLITMLQKLSKCEVKA